MTHYWTDEVGCHEERKCKCPDWDSLVLTMSLANVGGKVAVIWRSSEPLGEYGAVAGTFIVPLSSDIRA